jgi:hypothetical protein
MNIYEDYRNYIKEHKDMLDVLKSNYSSVNVIIDDVLKVMDYLSKKQEDGAKLNEDEIEVFDGGYYYITDVINDLKVYYEDYFKKDIIIFNHYSSLIFYSLYIDDYINYLISEECYTKVRRQAIETKKALIDDILLNHKEFDNNVVKEIEDVIEATMPKKQFKPVYEVYSLITEELDLF